MASLADRLQGAWNITSLEVEGNAVSGAALGTAQIVMQGDRFTTTGMGGAYGGTFVVEETDALHTIDLLYTEGEHTGKTSPGIVKLDDGCLTICMALAGGTRPKAFTTTPGSDHALEVLRRAETSNTAPATSSAEVQAGPTAGSAPIPAELSGDLEMLQGEWAMVSGRMGGENLFRQLVTTARRSVTGDHVTVSIGGAVFLDAAFTVDADTDPKSMDYTLLAGPNRGATLAGIYRIDGDTLTICYHSAGGPRPTEFAAEMGDGRTLGVWRRL